MFEAIKQQQVNFHRRNIKITESARDFLAKILNKNPAERLGTENGIKDLETHEFLQSLDFKKLENKQIEPPFTPSVEDDSDVSQVDPGFLNLPLGESVEPGKIAVSVSQNESRGIGDFTYVRPMDAFD